MNEIKCRRFAEEWVDHIVQQYDTTYVCPDDLPLIEYLLQEGFTLIAVRDKSKMLHVDFLSKKPCATKKQKVSHAKKQATSRSPRSD
jgi:hypothetical protein